jgi:hypothetical protein
MAVRETAPPTLLTVHYAMKFCQGLPEFVCFSANYSGTASMISISNQPKGCGAAAKSPPL